MNSTVTTSWIWAVDACYGTNWKAGAYYDYILFYICKMCKLDWPRPVNQVKNWELDNGCLLTHSHYYDYNSVLFYFDINTLTTTLEILFKIKIINLLSNLFFYFTFKFIKQMLSQIEIKTSKFINKCWEYILKCK